MNIDELALKVGATHYSPAPMRAVKGWSFTFEQLRALIAEYEKAAGSEPVGWRFLDDEEAGYIAYQGKPPTPEQVAYLEKWSRPAWEPLYARPDPRVAELEAQNAALMVAIEAKDAALSWINDRFADVSTLHIVREALSIQPSADLLAERDRKRDAALLRDVSTHPDMRILEERLLNNLAAARLDGSWVPELGDIRWN